MHEEDPALRLDHLYKVEVEEMLVLPKEGDEAMEGDAVVEGIAVAKEDSKIHKNRETEKNQHRYCQWVCGGNLSDKCWFCGFVK